MKTQTILNRSHPTPLGPLHVIRPHRLPPPAKPHGWWSCVTRLQGATMSAPSAFFIGHQGINLPHGLSLKNSTGEPAKRRKSMNSRSYTFYEVRQESGGPDSALNPALKTPCADAPRLGVFSTASNTSPFIPVSGKLRGAISGVESRSRWAFERVSPFHKTSFAFCTPRTGLSTGLAGGAK